MRKLDEFPATHESGVHGLILLFKVNSWNITRFLISMQKHLHCEVVSFGVTSMDPVGRQPALQNGRDELREAGRCLSLQRLRVMVRSLDFESWDVIREFEALTGHDPIFIFQTYLSAEWLMG